MTVAKLNAYVDAIDDQIDYVTDCFNEAVQMVDDEIAGRYVPDVILQRAIIEVGADLFFRKDAPNGISQFSDNTGATRIARDPMLTARKILKRYLRHPIA